MGPDAWRRQIGDSAWEYIAGPEARDSVVAAKLTAGVLTRAAEAGFAVPAVAPRVDPRGTKALWPRHRDGDGADPVLLANGLLRSWRAKGSGWVLLRAEQLLRACAGPLLPRLQEVLGSYEAQCEADGVAPLPEQAPRYFVGGDGDGVGEFLTHLVAACPPPEPVQRVSARSAP